MAKAIKSLILEFIEKSFTSTAAAQCQKLIFLYQHFHQVVLNSAPNEVRLGQ